MTQNHIQRKLPFSRALLLDLLFDPKSRLIFIYAFLIIFLGTAVYQWLEGWTWINSFYFVVVTFTTIGYGDFVPTTNLTKIITVFISLNGIAILLMLLDEIRRVRSKRLIHGSSNNAQTKDELSSQELQNRLNDLQNDLQSIIEKIEMAD